MPEITLTSTVRDKGLTTIPKEIRKKLNIKKGDKIFWILCNDETADLIIAREPLKFLTGRHSQNDLTYENLEEDADGLILDLVKKKSQ